MLAEQLMFGRTVLAQLPSDQQAQVHQAFEAVQTLEHQIRRASADRSQPDDHVLAEALRKARADLEQALASIRARSTSLVALHLDITDILAVVPEGRTLVAPLLTTQGSAVFVIPFGTEQVSEEQIVWLGLG